MGVIGARLAFELAETWTLASDGQLARVTAIIKTFERPRATARLLESALRLFPGLRLIVADDSREPRKLGGVETLHLPFDVGVSAGRQAALERVDTEFTWVLDDDFVLYWATRLGKVIDVLDTYAQIDIVGGPVIDLPLCIKHGAADTGLYPTQRQPRLPIGMRFGAVTVRDKVPNFFVARTERLRRVGYDSAIKRLDHADFFTRARGNLVTTYLDSFRCLHAPTPFDRGYMRFRTDYDADAAVIRARYFGGTHEPPVDSCAAHGIEIAR